MGRGAGKGEIRVGFRAANWKRDKGESQNAFFFLPETERAATHSSKRNTKVGHWYYNCQMQG